ncbi:MAG: hypothetical protein GVY24_06935, partial [Planctomycetes bacterium]|nr:hypothetical protein [Planctomycetota bacterium]
MKPNQLACVVLSIACISLAAAGAGGCGKTVNPDPPAPPAATYRGPDFLRTTIASVTRIVGYQPRFVSGYGLVVGLKGTGSPDCPPQLRQWLLNEMAQQGFGSDSMGYGQLTPAQVLASDRTAVVLVEGVTPPGAAPGTPFDIKVSALPQTQTTSLEGGRLYTTQLRIGGKAIGRPASRPIAVGRGDVFLNPFVSDSAGMTEPKSAPADPRVGRVIGGGQVVQGATILLRLNQPSYTLSRQIAERINGRFPQQPGDDDALAVAKTDEVVQIHVLERFRSNPSHMLDLISGLYLNPTDKFNRQRARKLVDLLAEPNMQRHAGQIALVW